MNPQLWKSEKVQPGMILDFDAQGQVVGIEILKLSLRTEPEKPPVADREGNCNIMHDGLSRKDP
jgi:uncharacterized protein YuzE